MGADREVNSRMAHCKHYICRWLHAVPGGNEKPAKMMSLDLHEGTCHMGQGPRGALYRPDYLASVTGSKGPDIAWIPAP